MKCKYPVICKEEASEEYYIGDTDSGIVIFLCKKHYELVDKFCTECENTCTKKDFLECYAFEVAKYFVPAIKEEEELSKEIKSSEEIKEGNLVWIHGGHIRKFSEDKETLKEFVDIAKIPIFGEWDRNLWRKPYNEIVEFLISRFRHTQSKIEYYYCMVYLKKELPANELYIPFENSPQYLKMLGSGSIATTEIKLQEKVSNSIKKVYTPKIMGTFPVKGRNV